jgi:DNA ligase 1
MNYAEIIYDTLNDLAAISSLNKKKEALKQAIMANEKLKAVCQLAYDPFIRFNMTALLPHQQQGGTEMPTFQVILDLLNGLKDRTVKASKAREQIEKWDFHHRWVFTAIINKDLRAGFTDTMLNDVFPGFVPEFDCMLAKKFEPKRIKEWPVAVQPKLDGVRCLIRLIKGEAPRFFSRNGIEEFANFPIISEELAHLSSTFGPKAVMWLDGELVSGSFNKTVGDVRRKSQSREDVVFTAFELLSEDAFRGLSNDTHADRYDILQSYLQTFQFDVVRVIENWSASSIDDILKHYARVRATGGEGVIVKPLNGKYVPKRSFDWLKIKGEETLDLKVINIFEGEGKYAGKLGGIIVDHKGVHVRVGSGFTDDEREPVSQALFDKYFGKIAEIQFHEVTPDGSLRHPRFKGIRFDKKKPD